MPEPLITLKNVSKQYQSELFSGVQDVSFSVEAGRIISIVGESGSGKSTLLKLIYGLLSPDSGTIRFKEELVPGPDEKLIPGHDQMKMVTQAFDLNIYAKVYDNIAGMLPNTNLKVKQEKALEIMSLLRINQLSNKRVVDLSGGEQQRVAVARAIITEPKVLLLDEPFSQVDSLLKNQLRTDIRKLSKELGITIILVSHDPADGLSLADELIILKNGKVLEQGSVPNLYNNPSNIYTAQLLANCNVISKAEAEKIGIKAKKEFVVIYPEWIKFKSSLSSKKFTVLDIVFKGFHEEIKIERKGVELRALNLKPETLQKSANVRLVFDRCLEFDEV